MILLVRSTLGQRLVGNGLIEQILAGTVVFAAEKEDDFISPFYTWPAPCGDCTLLGSSTVPEFWEE